MKQPAVLLLSISALLLPGSAHAAAPPDPTKDYWCGTALVQTFTVPQDAGDMPDLEARNARYADAGAALITRAITTQTAAGMTPDQITQFRQTLDARVATELEGDAKSAEYNFTDCTALLDALGKGTP
jgi:hypothetical protein